MARVTITPTVPGGNFDLNGAVVSWTAADATNHNQWLLAQGDTLLARNTGATGRVTTVTSAAINGRTGDQTVTIAAGAQHVFGPFKAAGWLQSDGYAYCTSAHLEVEFAVMRKVNP